MPANERGGLRAAFTNFNRPESEKEAEVRLLGREAEPQKETQPAPTPLPPQVLHNSYQTATAVPPPHASTAAPVPPLIPRPLVQREAVRQLSFRCPVTLAADLRRRAAYNQLEQQQIIIEGVRRVLAELPEPPADWQEL